MTILHAVRKIVLTTNGDYFLSQDTEIYIEAAQFCAPYMVSLHIL